MPLSFMHCHYEAEDLALKSAPAHPPGRRGTGSTPAWLAFMAVFSIMFAAVTSRVGAATFSVTTPGQQTLTNRFLPYAGSGTQLIGNSPAWRDSAGVLGINNYLEGLETLTPGAAVNLDFSTWRTKRITLNQNTIFTAINIPSASTNVQTMLLEVIGDGAFTVSFANVTWQTPEITTPEAGVVTLYALRGDSGAVKGYTQAVAASGVTTINPTDGYLPYRSNATTFADSPFYRISTNAIGFYSTNQFIWQGGPTTLTVGYQAGASQLLGNNSVVIGPRAGEFADGAFQSVGLGNDVLRLSQAGDNTAIGHLVMSFAIGAADNTGVGFEALKDLTEGYDNTAIGTEALKDLTIGYDNTAIGIGALASAITNIQLVALGSRALSDTLSGMRDTALGWHAGRTNVSGNDLTLIGYDANARTSADTNGIVIGANAVGNGSNTTVIGNTNTVSAHILASGYAGTGANFLSDDGTYKAAGGAALWSSSSGNLTPSPVVDVVSIESQSASAATNVAASVNTAATWTHNDATLQRWRNNGTNLVSFRTMTSGGVKMNFGENSVGTYAVMERSGGPSPYFDFYSTGTTHGFDLYSSDTAAYLKLRAGSAIRTVLEPGMIDGTAPYSFGSSLTHTSGNLAEFSNNGTNKVTVDYAGNVTATSATFNTWNIGTSGTSLIFFPTASSAMLSILTTGVRIKSTGILDFGAAADSISRESAGVFQFGADAAVPTDVLLKADDGLGTDKAGAAGGLAAGRSTGTGRPGDLTLQTGTTSTTSAATQNALTTRFQAVAKAVDLTESTATAFQKFTLATNNYAGGSITATVRASDAAFAMQSLTSTLKFDAVNVGGTNNVTVTQVDSTLAQIPAGGTLTCTYTVVDEGSNVFAIKANAVSSLTQTALRVKWVITALNSSDAIIVTPQP